MNGSVADVLVVGYGNDLRSDDGAGRWVADRVDEWVERLGLDGVEVRSMAQLTPEVSLAAAGCDLVVFVDASVDVEELTVADVSGEDGDAAGPGSVMTHHGNPSSVVAMTASVGEPPGRAVLVSIPASDLEMGFEFSPATATAADEAVAAITELISTVRRDA